jgi:hypothetical protein
MATAATPFEPVMRQLRHQPASELQRSVVHRHHLLSRAA